MLAPAGVLQAKLANMPAKKQATEIIAEKIPTLKKFLQIFIALRAGKTIRLEIIIAPISLMPITTVSAVKIAISALYAFVFIPAAFAKGSSNVTANILL